MSNQLKDQAQSTPGVTFKDAIIADVVITPLTRHIDSRGSLVELYREDELASTVYPAMGYISETMPGVTRGPHEHERQTDYFCFIGPGTFTVYLWDNRPDSATYRCRMVFEAGIRRPISLQVPPGVVHAYQNTGDDIGAVFNGPNSLYAGWKKQCAVDEIRHEQDPNTIYKIPPIEKSEPNSTVTLQFDNGHDKQLFLTALSSDWGSEFVNVGWNGNLHNVQNLYVQLASTSLFGDADDATDMQVTPLLPGDDNEVIVTYDNWGK